VILLKSYILKGTSRYEYKKKKFSILTLNTFLAITIKDHGVIKPRNVAQW
jgi:hypothetical protein